MWYFTWILGVLLACAFGIVNVMWYEFRLIHFRDGSEDECGESRDASKTDAPS